MDYPFSCAPVALCPAEVQGSLTHNLGGKGEELIISMTLPVTVHGRADAELTSSPFVRSLGESGSLRKIQAQGIKETKGMQCQPGLADVCFETVSDKLSNQREEELLRPF